MTTLDDRTITTDLADIGDFTASLRQEHDDLFEAFWAHPFLRELRAGTLSREATLHYVGQDHHYLSAYLRCYGLGMAKSPDRPWMRHFVDSSLFLLEDESHPHHVMCESFGVQYEAVQHDRLAPSAQAYIDHMMECGHDSLGVLMFALLPCPWTYIWAGNRYLAQHDNPADNKFEGWWQFYGSPDCNDLLANLLQRCEALAQEAGPAERARMARAFELSCHHEIRFWQLAYTRETWGDLPRSILAG
ncbi:thiaminase/transcriptional activator TenA [Kineosphaera limosa]|uniref:Putative TenA family transcriptional activator n=1 Tax=Kineosphaera limosa NBRC 100340 TaxID=1184609 RepID=K6XDD9_9MICO|nr:TenA family protein [Kineosphaera limosa]NYE00722.1 thiaminase/transcriptional activator TenA [Kineosphaera limosa]GAB96809.1 putative TenA family transcriptional activator [Kineosphaera limosa NBRC 100340]